MLLNKTSYLNLTNEISVLFRTCYKKDISIEYLQWRYLNNPINDLLAAVNIEDKCLTSNYSASPCFMVIDDKAYKTGLSMTTMTSPDYRGRGLFPQLANQLYDYMVSLDYLMVWGFPNKNSHKTFKESLNWIDISEIPTMKLNLKTCTTSKMPIPCFDNEFTLDYTRIKSAKNLIQIKKDQKYLVWRYCNNPVNIYKNLVICQGERVSSFCIIKFYEFDMDLIDIQSNDRDEAEYLLKQAIEFGVNHGRTTLNCWAPTHHFIYSLCKKMGFTISNQITNFGFRLLKETKYENYIKNYENWFIQMGDSDVY